GLLPMAFGLFYGIEIFTYILVCSKFLVLFAYILFAQQKLQIDWREQWKRIIIPFVPLSICIIVFTILTPLILEATSIDMLLLDVIQTILFVIIFIVYLKIIKHESYHVLIGMISNLKSRIKNL